MSRVTIWFGPVNLVQVKNAALPRGIALNFQCKGDGSPSCAASAEAWKDSRGRRLPNALAALHQPAPSPEDDLAYGAFSAGGSVVKRLLLAAEDREPVRVVTLADATYTDWQAPGVPVPPEGFVLFALDVLSGAHGPKLFVATASSNAPVSRGKALPSGSQTLAALRMAIESRSGQRFAPATLPGVSPAPVAAWKLGNILFADYGSTVPHANHALDLAPQVWSKVVLPWWAARAISPPGGGGSPSTPEPPAPGPPDTSFTDLLALLGVALVSASIGFGVTRYALRRRF